MQSPSAGTRPSSTAWPALPFDHWESTCDTVHLWTQIVGKTRLKLTPLENHFWNVPFYVTPRGITTSAVPFGEHGARSFDAEFDFRSHQLILRTDDGREQSIKLYPRSVADFYAEYMSVLRTLGIEVHLVKTPAEFDDPTPFDQDQHHASYDSEYVERFQDILVRSNTVLKQFRARFIGKCSPVQFFWGSFDLAVSRFSGRPSPQPATVDPITREAYSHEDSACGFWPGDRRFRYPAFYAYTAPKPAGLELEKIQPEAGYWNAQLGEFILKYDDVRSSASPEEAILAFCQSTYAAGANLAHWDRANLER